MQLSTLLFLLAMTKFPTRNRLKKKDLSWLMIQFREDAMVADCGCGSRTTRLLVHILVVHKSERRQEAGTGHKLSRPTPSDPLPPARLHIPKCFINLQTMTSHRLKTQCDSHRHGELPCLCHQWAAHLAKNGWPTAGTSQMIVSEDTRIS